MVRQYHLSDRQKIAIEYISKHGSLTIQQFESVSPDVTGRTLQRELKELVEKNILITPGATSNLVYQMNAVSKHE